MKEYYNNKAIETVEIIKGKGWGEENKKGREKKRREDKSEIYGEEDE
jgi:hypothetical protein